MPAFVIETNVPVVANNLRSPQADDACVLACTRVLRECADILNNKKTGHVVIDAGGEILEEYKRHLSFRGQPGVGDLFFKELFNHQGKAVCEKVEIHKNDLRGYEEFPEDPALATFDPSDRKFAAVAKASRNNPTIINAVDSDWSQHQIALRRNKIKVTEICPHCIKKIISRR